MSKSSPAPAALSAADTPNGRFLTALQNAVAPLLGKNPPSNEQLEALALALNDVDVSGDALPMFMLGKITITHFQLGRAADVGRWSLGVPYHRLALVRHLRSAALASGSAVMARAAVRLCWQESFRFGPAWAHRLLGEPQVVAVTGWSDREVQRLRGLAEHEHHLTGQILGLALEAAKPLDRIRADPGPALDRTLVESFSDAIDRAAALPARGDGQWQVVHFLWKMLNLARSKGGDDVVAAMLERLNTLYKAWTALYVRNWIAQARRMPLDPTSCWSGLSIIDPSHLVIPDDVLL